MSKVSKNVKPLAKPQNALDKSDRLGVIIPKMLLAFGLVCILATVVFDKSKEMGGVVFPVMCLCAVLFCAGWLYVERRLNPDTIALLIIAAGFVIRLNYVIYTPLSETTRVRQHDMFEFGGEIGHSAYIEHFYNNGFTLPDFDPTTKAQFYHPPLHHLLAAMWMRILTTFGMGYTRAIGSLQFLSLFYSCCLMLTCERIFTRLRLSGYYKLIALSIVVFHPTMILLSGSVNNDQLALLFTMLSVLTTLRWYDEPTTKNILWIALSIGLGMSTKLSAALVSIPIAMVFLAKLIREKKKIYENILQYCIFGVVCLPLGLWFSIRNAIRFEVPFTYVQKLPETSDQYVGNYSVFQRLFDFSDHPFKNVFLNKIPNGDGFFEYNPFVGIIKMSMFGEYNYSNHGDAIVVMCRVLLVLNILMIALSLAATVYFLVKKGSELDGVKKFFLLFYQVLMFVYFIKFCFDFPHNCSMDFRYIVPTCILGAYFIAYSLQEFDKTRKKDSVAVKTADISVTALSLAFCLFSCIVYIMLGA